MADTDVRSRTEGSVPVRACPSPLLPFVVLMFVAGCAGRTPAPSSGNFDPGPEFTDVADSAALYGGPAPALPALPELPAPLAEAPTDESLADKILRFHPSLRSVEELYADGTQLWFEGDLDAADERFLQLREQLEASRPADPDSLTLLYLGSMERRLRALQQVMAEERFFLESYVPYRQDLTATYDSLRIHVALPDFLLPRPEPDAFREQLLGVEHPRVDHWIEYFQGRGRKEFERWLARKARYGPVIESILVEEGLPRELVYLAMIESGLSPRAHSRASAVGWWQFVRSTARTRGLIVNDWLDERRDLEKSTRAAARHLKLLYGMFGDWALALAAYNSGEYRIQRLIGLHGDPDFWEMRLPRETRDYVPKFIAAVRVGEAAEEYGFAPAHTDTLRYDVVELDDTFSLDQVAKAGGFSQKELAELNPQLLANCTPPDIDRYALRVPAGKGASTAAGLRAIPEGQRITWRKHRLRRGETLGQLARKYHTSVRAIMDLNHIRNARRVRAGTVLTIPHPRGAAAPSRPRVASRRPKVTVPEGMQAVRYRVRSGDTLIGIAQKYGIGVSTIRRINGIRGNRIRAGETLTLHLPADRAQGLATATSAPPVSPQSHEKEEYVVRPGDTLYAIGRRFGVDVAALAEWNDLDPASPLRPGKALIIWRPRSR